ncbi:MAG TPA: hypothetical protein VIY68_12535 [Steroidobacteraceae bacterium]
MKIVATMAKTAIMAVLCISVSATADRDALATESAKTAPCESPVYRQFDFWIGDWDAFDVGEPSKMVARTQVTRILGGCVLLEDYQGADGHFGRSFSIYDSLRNRWHQTWVTNQGTLLMIEGGLEKGKMVLRGADRIKDKTRQVRGVWKAVPEGVQETAVISTDGGKTWSQWFDLIFRSHKP